MTERARSFGFGRPILHALVEGRFGADPAALRRLKVAFRAAPPSRVFRGVVY